MAAWNVTRRCHCGVLAVGLALVLVCSQLLGTRPVGAQSVGGLFGVVDEVVSADPGRIIVRGWALDPADPGPSVAISVTNLGPHGVTTTYETGVADRFRNDVGAAVFPHEAPGTQLCEFACGPRDYHGFEVVLTGQRAGVNQVCVDAHLGEAHVRLGCELLRVARPSRHDPTGSLLSVAALSGPAVEVQGWAFDPDAPADALLVHIYVLRNAQWSSPFLGIDQERCALGVLLCSGPVGQQRPTGGKDVIADQPSPEGLNGVAGHSFRATVMPEEFAVTPQFPPRDPDALPARVCAFAENRGPGRDTLLGCAWLQLP